MPAANGPEEHAEPGRSSDSFPVEWGIPAGRQYSSERAAWVRDRVARFAGLRALDKLAAADRRHLQMLQRAVLMSRREGP